MLLTKIASIILVINLMIPTIEAESCPRCVCEPNYVPSNSSHHYPNYRAKRATPEEFSTSVEQMQMISRVTNGIYLQQGLIKGTILSDDLISELLNFGSVTPSQIEQINADTLKKVVKGIHDLPTKLKVDDGITKIEERFLVLSSLVKKSNGVEKVEKPSEEYSNAVNSFDTTTVDWSNLKGLVGRFKKFITSVAALESPIDNIKHELDDHIGEVQRFTIEVKGEDYGNTEILLKSDILRQSDQIFVSIKNFQNSLKEYSANAGLLGYHGGQDPQILTSVSRQMYELGKVVNDVKASLPVFEDLKRIFVSRHHRSGDRGLKHTFGLPNGHSDLDLIFDALKNGWIKEVIGGQSENLARTLEEIRTIGRLSSQVDVSIGVKSDERFQTVLNTFPKMIELTKRDFQYDLLASRLSEIQEIVITPPRLPQNEHNLTLLHQKMTSLSTKLLAIDNVIALSSKLRTEMPEQLNTVIELSVSVSKAELPQKLAELKESQEYQEIVKVVREIQESVQVLESGVNVEEQLKYIKDHYEEVDKYITGSDPFMNMLTSLRAIPELGAAEDVIKAIREYRGVKVESFDSVAKSIPEIKKTVKNLKDSINKMKGFKSSETDVLIGLPDVSKDSEVIGSATRGISNMKKTMEKKSDGKVDKLNTIGTMIKGEMGKVSLDAEDQKNLNSLIEFGGKLTKVYSSLDSFRNSVKTSTSSKLSDHSGIFTEARKYPGFNGDLMKMSDSVEKLAMAIQVTNPTSAQSLREIKSILENLDSNGLNFAKYSTAFDSSKDTLTSLDLFFANYAIKVTPTKPPIAAQQGPGGQFSTSTKGPEELTGKSEECEKPSSGLMIFLIICTVGFWILLVLFVCLLIKYVREKKKSKKSPDGTDAEKGALLPAPAEDQIPATAGTKEIVPPTGDQIPATTGTKEKIPEKKPTEPKVIVPPPEPDLIPPVRTIKLVEAPTLVDEKSRNFFFDFSYKFERFKTVNKMDDKDMGEVMPAFLNHQFEIDKAAVGDGTLKAKYELDKDLFKGVTYDARCFKYLTNAELYLTSGPQTKSEIEEFWTLVMMTKVRTILKLGPNDKYFPSIQGGLMKFGHFTIKCTFYDYALLKEGDTQFVETRVLSVQYKDQPKFDVKHMWNKDWNENKVAHYTIDVVDFNRFLKNCKEPALVHCSGSIERTSLFICGQIGYQMLINDEKFTLQSWLREIRSINPNYIQNWLEYGFCIHTIFKLLRRRDIDKLSNEAYNAYISICENFEKWSDQRYEEWKKKHDEGRKKIDEEMKEEERKRREESRKEKYKKPVFEFDPDRVPVTKRRWL